MPDVTLEHFRRAAVDVGAHGDNDTLPFDIDNRFINEKSDELARIAFGFYSRLENKSEDEVVAAINSLQIFFERLLVPTGASGFRITTKIHPFWNVYLNGLGVAVAERHEPQRSNQAHSYRFTGEGDGLFDRGKSWRSYREVTLGDEKLAKDGSVVVQTDISSFYERVYHHRLENCVSDLFPNGSTVPKQLDRLLNKLANGRSFGLPVGGQCARILAEVMMSPIDQVLNEKRVTSHRYVDDFTMITSSQQDAYRALSVLSNALADYGLSLNRTKTTILKAKHYVDFVNAQLKPADDGGGVLSEIDLHFDPYSDNAVDNYGELKETIAKLDIQLLLQIELTKAQPDTFLVAQISRSLKLHPPFIAINLCATLLNPDNLNAFRASWPTIMRGIATVRADEENEAIFEELDVLLDQVPERSPHLLLPEANCLHYLKSIRFRRTDARARYVAEVYHSTSAQTVKRACIECWRLWLDRPNFIGLRNRWQNLGVEEQRMLWLAAGNFGDDGTKARGQLRKTLPNAWQLGIEIDDQETFGRLFSSWSENEI
jgi:hypothetical protein